MAKVEVVEFLELHEALAGAKPDLVSIELGFDVAIKGSQLLAMIVDACTEASVRVELEWRGNQTGDRDSADESNEAPNDDDSDKS